MYTFVYYNCVFPEGSELFKAEKNAGDHEPIRKYINAVGGGNYILYEAFF